MSNQKLKVVFFGTPDFAIPALETLVHHGHIELIDIISMPDRPAGRGQNLHSPAVIEYAKKNKLSFFQTANINQEKNKIDELKKQQIDFFVVLAFAQFLSQEVLDIPRLGAFNIHTSLLPKFRGAAPIQYALLNGESTTGVSIQKMVKKMDAGDIAQQMITTIRPNEALPELATRLKFLSALCLSKLIELMIENKLEYQKQDESQVSYAPEIKKEWGEVNFSKESAQDIYARYRAFHPWPGIYSFLFLSGQAKRFKILECLPHSENISPGKIICSSQGLIVGTPNASLLITSLQLEGKKKVRACDFIKSIPKDQRDALTLAHNPGSKG